MADSDPGAIFSSHVAYVLMVTIFGWFLLTGSLAQVVLVTVLAVCLMLSQYQLWPVAVTRSLVGPGHLALWLCCYLDPDHHGVAFSAGPALLSHCSHKIVRSVSLTKHSMIVVDEMGVEPEAKPL